MPVDPTFAVSGAEWAMPAIEAPEPTADAVGGSGGGSFGDTLSQAIGGLAQKQSEAASASEALASGTATDPTSVVLAVERAQLAMQLATQIRTKAVESVQEVFRTQV